ncbi:hypothetical protein ACFU5O_27815 [Streptomyces sp. NPDC057445]|uniref:hypothetical protein n=1 Tax=Streptomyces sp. NPDC057445 TaxID=3346136 RepID=UPI0036A6D269
MLEHLAKTLHSGLLNDCFYQAWTAVCRKRAKAAGWPLPLYNMCLSCPSARRSTIHVPRLRTARDQALSVLEMRQKDRATARGRLAHRMNEETDLRIWQTFGRLRHGSRPLTDIDQALMDAFERLTHDLSETTDGKVTIVNVCTEADVSRASYYSPVAQAVKETLETPQTRRPEPEELRAEVSRLKKAERELRREHASAVRELSLPTWELDGSFLAQSTMGRYRTELKATPRYEETAPARLRPGQADDPGPTDARARGTGPSCTARQRPLPGGDRGPVPRAARRLRRQQPPRRRDRRGPGAGTSSTKAAAGAETATTAPRPATSSPSNGPSSCHRN